jgi:hypothetical protein
MTARTAERPLTARELREALRLVLTELEDMGMPPAADDDKILAWCYRLGGLKASVEGLLEGGRHSRSALTVLRRHVAERGEPR